MVPDCNQFALYNGEMLNSSPALYREAGRVASHRLHAEGFFCFDDPAAGPLYRLPPPVVLQQLSPGPWHQEGAWAHD